MKRFFIFSALIVAFVFVKQSQSAFALQAQPITVTSWYVHVGNTESDGALTTWAYNEGLAVGNQALHTTGTQFSYSILDFGQPWMTGTSTYGTWPPDAATARFQSTTSIRSAATWFAYGYIIATWNGGSGGATSSQFYMLIGTNNYKDSTGYVTYNHGVAWSQLVQNIGADLHSYGYDTQVHVYGASDIELHWPGATASASTAKAWVNGYNSVWKSPYYYFDYGDANGCPQSGTTHTPGNCYTGWTQDDVNYVAYESGAYPLPEIYSSAGGDAKEWQQLSLYQYLKHGYSELITGPLSQYGACQTHGPCTGTDNTSTTSWSQLWTQLNNATSTAQSLYLSTDITWK